MSSLKFLTPLLENPLFWLPYLPFLHFEFELWLQDLFLLILNPYSDCELTLVSDLLPIRPLCIDPRLFLMLILVFETLLSPVGIFEFLLNILGNKSVL